MGVRFDEGAECVIDEGAEQLRQREREMEQLRERDVMFLMTVVFVCVTVGVTVGDK